ncbi:MAG: shikimate dehydrogenase [Parabacteroides sp.]|nr:shikimate dehydrogenase [Parabacteroides sp.]
MGSIPVTERVTGHTELIGLIAKPIRHSMSPTMHNEAFKKLGLDYVYVVFEVDNDNLEDAVTGLRAMGVRGWNVSMPNKVAITKYLDKLSPASQIIGAVNTVVNDNGVLTGTITDGTGALKSLEEAGVDYKGKTLTIFGAGGAATAIQVQAALDGAKEIKIFNIKDAHYANGEATVKKLTESKETNCIVSIGDLADLDAVKAALDASDIHIDATSCGMKPLEDVTPFPDKSFLRPDLFVMDVVYSPRQTKLLKWCEEVGCPHINGLGMMLWQGAAAFKLWTGHDMPTDHIKEIIF